MNFFQCLEGPKSNWTVGERVLAPDQWVLWLCRLILFEVQWTFFQYLIWKFIDFEKIICKKAVNYNTWYSWNCSQCHLALWTNHFVNRTFRESNWRVVESLIASDQAAVWKRRPILSKGQWIFFQCLVWRFIHFEEIVFEGASWWCHFTLKELLRLSCGLANRSFCRSDI